MCSPRSSVLLAARSGFSCSPCLAGSQQGDVGPALGLGVFRPHSPLHLNPAAPVTQPRRSLLLHALGRCWRVSHPRVMWGLNVAACHRSWAPVGSCPWCQLLPRLAGKPRSPLTLQVLLLRLQRKAIPRSLEMPVVAPGPSLLRSSPYQPCGAAQQGLGGRHLCQVTPQPPLSSGYHRGCEVGGNRNTEKLCHFPGRQLRSPSRRSDTPVLRK